MEELKAKLFRLLKDEIYDLNIGHSYNTVRIRMMKELCKVLMYYSWAGEQHVQPLDIKKVIKLYL